MSYLREWIESCDLCGAYSDELPPAIAAFIAVSSLGALVMALVLGWSVPLPASSPKLYLALGGAAFLGFMLMGDNWLCFFSRFWVVPLGNTAAVALSATAVASTSPEVFHPWVVVFVSLSLLLLSFGLQLSMANATYDDVVSLVRFCRNRKDAARALEAPVTSGGPLVIEIAAPPQQKLVNVAVRGQGSSLPAQVPLETFGRWARAVQPGRIYLFREAKLELLMIPDSYRAVETSFQLIGGSEPIFIGWDGKIVPRAVVFWAPVAVGLAVQVAFDVLVLIVALTLSWVWGISAIGAG